MKIAASKTKIPLSLYVHLPWCIEKCPYCDLNSHPLREPAVPEANYLKQLKRDLLHDIDKVSGRTLSSIFFGGGTPSLFSPEIIDDLLSFVRQHLSYDNIEITLEANPGTVDQAHFSGYRQAGVNRISLGVQSFQNEKLKQLGRIHDDDDAFKAIDIIKACQFPQFNLDLMYGLPKQNLDEAMSDLELAIKSNTQHISWYQLTLEPNTPFYRHPPPLPKHDEIANINQHGHELLLQHDFQHYEVSAYAHPGELCLHNENYWQFGDYLGIGAGAHGKISNVETGMIERTVKVKHPKRYLSVEDNFISESKCIDKRDLIFEFMLNTCRLQKPCTWNLLHERTGLEQKDIEPALSIAKEKDLLNFDAKTFQPTALGKRFLNELLEIFLG